MDENTFLEHHGVKGMKWGVRRYQNEDGSLTSAGKKKYALKGYSEDAYNSNKTKIGKIYDRLTDAHKYSGDIQYGRSSQSERNARAEKYERDHKNGEKLQNLNKEKIARVGMGVATVAAAAYYVHKNPEKIGQVVSKFRGVKVSEVSQKAVDAGKRYVKNRLKDAANGVREGVKEGIKEAPKKAAKTVVTGVVLNQTKKYLDRTVGKEESARIFQANDNKKIGKFWKVGPEDRDDDD